ncbi:uncharacterized protein LOC121367498 isoform X2 [Gigantopelta aegis]|uniref:uncharacterized protein LOC121367498 isoform X2 n=1 Tax=Gigantopelta aegis TaxID=1735272 RepID=UPI001B889E9A|nr:uncharacterized protein LOC121367498 isoform X2 [Gigantopelta aegis]
MTWTLLIVPLLGALLIDASRSTSTTSSTSTTKTNSFNGQWSGWTVSEHIDCDDHCLETIVYKRTCRKPVPSIEGRPCFGNSTSNTTTVCRWDLCAIEKFVGLGMGRIVVIAILVLLLVTLSAVCFFTRKKKTKEARKPEAIKIVRHPEDKVKVRAPKRSPSYQMQYDNPAFSASPERIVPRKVFNPSKVKRQS